MVVEESEVPVYGEDSPKTKRRKEERRVKFAQLKRTDLEKEPVIKLEKIDKGYGEKTVPEGKATENPPSPPPPPSPRPTPAPRTASSGGDGADAGAGDGGSSGETGNIYEKNSFIFIIEEIF